MEAWAANSDFGHIAFICINVDTPVTASLQAAKQFSANLHLANCYTGFIRDKKNMPLFGQLGCSGFIISKPDGSIIVPKSPPYLQYQNNAFYWMENYFHSMMKSKVNVSKICDDPVIEKPAASKPSTSSEHGSPSSATIDRSDGMYNISRISIESMDQEHKECFELLTQASDNVHDKQILKTTLQDLYCHLEDHFTHEEHLMNKCQFGGGMGGKGFLGHRLDHDQILKKITLYLEMNGSCISDNDAKKFISELTTHLNHHVANYDSLYVDTFREHGIH